MERSLLIITSLLISQLAFITISAVSLLDARGELHAIHHELAEGNAKLSANFQQLELSVRELKAMTALLKAQTETLEMRLPAPSP